MSDRLSPGLLVQAYSRGLFPMAESRDDSQLFWVDPEERGVLPIEGFHVPKRLRRTVRQDRFRITHDLAFEQVITACSELDHRRGRFDSWINVEIVRAYAELFRLGHAHSIECWQEGKIVGGLYGVSIGAAFFGESMFSAATDASKVALVHLVARLRAGGYILLDSQFVNDHLKQFHIESVPKPEYLKRLQAALPLVADFEKVPMGTDGATMLRLLTDPA
ncbi:MULTISPECIES: leucyl/phenylalanyl-tRNA--protein transferase [unclassified Minwuia]|uniref:leucyl/phenylalanyl-tRNA--protein transferase n=1 Tax=unclassified Minwuia TaxID=2618799 RepID=UPI00247A67F1|nr:MULTISPECIES: leucyl/phenylalanyl-tRNA--protein transferase [unclassified Minwuia]